MAVSLVDWEPPGGIHLLCIYYASFLFFSFLFFFFCLFRAAFMAFGGSQARG